MMTIFRIVYKGVEYVYRVKLVWNYYLDRYYPKAYLDHTVEDVK